MTDTQKKKASSMSIGYRKQISLLPGYVFAILWVALLAVMIGWILLASVAYTKDIFVGKLFRTGVRWSNYYNAVVKFKVGIYFLNSVIYTSCTCLGAVLLAAPAAYALTRFRFSANKVIRTAFVASQGIPGIMLILPLFAITASLRLTNMRGMLIFLYIGMAMPFTVFFLLIFFSKLSPSFEEAAAIDGCGEIETFWRVMMPLAQPGIITVTIFNFISFWNEYFMALIFTTKNELRPVSVGLYQMIESMRYIGDWGAMFAAVVVVFMPTFVLYLFLSQKIVAGITGGAIKG